MPSLQYSLMMTGLNLFPKIEFPIYIDYIITFSLHNTTYQIIQETLSSESTNSVNSRA
jgi:hypothetical protein